MQNNLYKNQAVITGIGLLSPIGNDLDTVKRSLRNGTCGIGPSTKLDVRHFRSNYAGEIKDFSPKDYLSDKELAQLTDPYLIYSIYSSRMALQDSKLEIGNETINRDIGIVLGTCNGGLVSAEAQYRVENDNPDFEFNENIHLQSQFYGFGKALGYYLGIGGDVWTITTACSSTTGALGIAQNLINLGYYKTVLVGGTDSLSLANLAGFEGLKVTSPEIAAPFSIPTGLNVGEASCFWVLEEMNKAKTRNAHIYGRIVSHATSSDGYHQTAPDPKGDGAYLTLQTTLSRGELKIEDLGCINLHGTGTELNDKAESRGIAKLLNGTEMPCVSTKSYFGHCMGSTGILEATCNLLAMNDDFIPPTLHFKEPRPGCSLDYVPNKRREKKYNAFASLNYAFGGNNAAVIIAKENEFLKPITTKETRVVLTGYGAMSSIGHNVDEILDSLRNNQVGLFDVNGKFNCSFESKKIGFVREFTNRGINPRLDFSTMNKVSQMATAASWMSLKSAELKPNRKNCHHFGIALGLCNGSEETEHMESTFSTDNHIANIASFSNITPNSVIGGISRSLCLKGTNTTLSNGHHSSIQGLAYAYDTIVLEDSEFMIAGGADEVYELIYKNYNSLNWFCLGDQEENFKLRLDNKKEKVLGEGAAFVTVESLASATNRDIPILAEVLGYGSSTDGNEFFNQCLDSGGLDYACTTALTRSKLISDDIDLIIWAPQGNIQDQKVLDLYQKYWNSDIPIVTTTFNTGYLESSSIMLTLICCLASLNKDESLWQQRTGIDSIDTMKRDKTIRKILVLASSDLGYNYAMALQRIP